MHTWARTSGGRRAIGALAALGMLAASPLAAQPVLSVRAGLGGYARAGRWMPVEVVVTSDTTRDGQLLVTWGDARAMRPLHVLPGSPVLTTVALRTGDPRAGVTVTFEDTTGVSDARASLRILPDDQTLTACIGDGDGCDVVLAPGEAPRDWRAWDAADTIRATTGTLLDPDRADAVARAMGARAAEAAFDAPMPAALRTSPVASEPVRPWLLLMFVPALVAAVPWTRRAPLRLAVAAGLIAAVSAGAVTSGHGGPRLLLRHATTLHAFAGSSATIVETHAAMTARTDGPLSIALTSAHGWLERPGPALSPVRLDEAGTPIVELRPRLGETVRIDAEADGPPSPLHVEVAAHGVTLTPTGTTPLIGCRGPAGLAPALPDTLVPGVVLTLDGHLQPGDAITCTWSGGPPLVLPGVGHAAGASTLQMHLDPVTP